MRSRRTAWNDDGASTIRVVVDLNIFVSSLLGSSSCRRVTAAIVEGTITPVVSSSFLTTLRGVLGRPKFRSVIGPAACDELLSLLEVRALRVLPRHAVRIARDPDDDQLLSLALEGAAKAIVSGDNDLTSLGSFSGIPILTPGQFLLWRERQ